MPTKVIARGGRAVAWSILLCLAYLNSPAAVGQQGVAPKKLEGDYGIPWAARYSPDGSMLATCGKCDTSSDCKGYDSLLWDLKTSTATRLTHDDGDWIWNQAFSPNGKILATVTHQALYLWDTKTKRRIQKILSKSKCSVVFGPTGLLIAAAGLTTDEVAVYDVETGKTKCAFRGHRDGVFVIAFSHKGDVLATGDFDGVVRLWNLAKLDVALVEWKGHQQRVLAVAFSPDDKALISVGPDKTIRHWNIASREATVHQLPEKGDIKEMALSSSGNVVATSDWGDVKLWEVGNGRLVANLGKHTGSVTALALCSDGKQLAVCGVKGGDTDRGMIHLWPVSVEKKP